MNKPFKEVHQFVHTLSYGDAISSEVLALQKFFHERGVDSKIYCINAHPRYKEIAHDYRDFRENHGSDFNGMIVLHYSLGSPLNELYLDLTNACKSLIYHNLTPPEWFSGINPRIVDDINVGKAELPKLCAKTDLLIADSTYNASELQDLGFEAEVLNLPINPSRWDFPANPGIASILQSDSSIHVLHIGRFAPNKCLEDILKTFYFLHHHVNKNSKLWLPGIDIDTELYSFSVKKLAQELRIDHAVNFVGRLDDSEIRALYENCSVYLCMSEHEGFCLPVIEAMHFGLPVLSFASSALPDTVSTGGILFSQKRYAELAELINLIHVDRALRGSLIESGRQRIQELSYDRFEKRADQLFVSQHQDFASRGSVLKAS